jgi:hypothetical protein
MGKIRLPPSRNIWLRVHGVVISRGERPLEARPSRGRLATLFSLQLSAIVRSRFFHSHK